MVEVVEEKEEGVVEVIEVGVVRLNVGGVGRLRPKLLVLVFVLELRFELRLLLENKKLGEEIGEVVSEEMEGLAVMGIVVGLVAVGAVVSWKLFEFKRLGEMLRLANKEANESLKLLLPILFPPPTLFKTGAVVLVTVLVSLITTLPPVLTPPVLNPPTLTPVLIGATT